LQNHCEHQQHTTTIKNKPKPKERYNKAMPQPSQNHSKPLQIIATPHQNHTQTASRGMTKPHHNLAKTTSKPMQVRMP
jgi:hypothetical protein